MRRTLLLWGAVALTTSPAVAQEGVYIPHITKEMQSRSRVARKFDYTRGLTITQKRQRNEWVHVSDSRRKQIRSLMEQRRRLEVDSHAPYTAANILGMRERNATSARGSASTLAHRRQKEWEAKRMTQENHARATLRRQKEIRNRQSMDERNLRDRGGEALRAQKRQVAIRMANQKSAANRSPYRGVTMAQRRLLNRR